MLCKVLECDKEVSNSLNIYCSRDCYFLTRKGYKHKESSLKKMRDKRAGQIFSEETKKKIGDSRRGSKDSLESRRKKSEARMGAKNPAWKGGVSPINKAFRNRIDYALWREEVFKRDEFVCQMPSCGQWGGKLEANHIKLYSEHPALRLVVSNGITLCSSCHKSIRQKEYFYEKLFIGINTLK